MTCLPTFAKLMRCAGVAALAVLLWAGIPGGAGAATLTIGYVGPEAQTPASFGPPGKSIKDEGLAGALLGAADNDTTGKFIGQSFELATQLLEAGGESADAVRVLTE